MLNSTFFRLNLISKVSKAKPHILAVAPSNVSTSAVRADKLLLLVRHVQPFFLLRRESHINFLLQFFLDIFDITISLLLFFLSISLLETHHLIIFINQIYNLLTTYKIFYLRLLWTI